HGRAGGGTQEAQQSGAAGSGRQGAGMTEAFELVALLRQAHVAVVGSLGVSEQCALSALLRERPTEGLATLRSRALVRAVIGVIGLAAGLLTSAETFWQSYLIGYIFWMGITLGSLALLMVQYLSGG